MAIVWRKIDFTSNKEVEELLDDVDVDVRECKSQGFALLPLAGQRLLEPYRSVDQQSSLDLVLLHVVRVWVRDDRDEFLGLKSSMLVLA